ncbi:MAG TPA: hypothetical protein VMH88_09200 [Gemmatimonadales bacterium]|nr:hypothetical protein [Gemmatimonadales bacterium]
MNTGAAGTAVTGAGAGEIGGGAGAGGGAAMGTAAPTPATASAGSGLTLITWLQTAQRARTPAAGTLAGSTRYTVSQDGQVTFT